VPSVQPRVKNVAEAIRDCAVHPQADRDWVAELIGRPRSG
jgi:hypothetical protein